MPLAAMLLPIAHAGKAFDILPNFYIFLSEALRKDS